MGGVLKAAREDSRGANLVEFALVAVLLLIILAGVVDIGRLFHSWIIVTNASREGARYASRHPALADLIRQAAILEAAGSDVDLYAENVTIIGLNGASGSPIRVKVDYRYDTMMGNMINAGAGITLTGTTEMIVFGSED